MKIRKLFCIVLAAVMLSLAVCVGSYADSSTEFDDAFAFADTFCREYYRALWLDEDYDFSKYTAYDNVLEYLNTNIEYTKLHVSICELRDLIDDENRPVLGEFHYDTPVINDDPNSSPVVVGDTVIIAVIAVVVIAAVVVGILLARKNKK